MNEITNKMTRTDWEALIAEQEKSGLTQQVFCEQRGIVFTSFVYYRSRIKKKTEGSHQSQASFSPVKIVKKEETATGDIRLSLPNGFQCAFPSHIDPAQIKRLVEVLLSC
jgi:hypothetical protein